MKLTNSLPKPTLSFDSTIIHLIEQQNYPDAKKLLVSSTLANDIFFTKDNVFNYLLSKIQNYHIFFQR